MTDQPEHSPEPDVPTSPPADSTRPPADSTPPPPAAPIPPAPGAPGAYGQPGQPGYGQPGSQPGYGQPAYGGQAPLSESDSRMWAMLGHLGGIVLGFLAPLITWLVFRERSELVDDQGKEALNFQITLLIAYVVSSLLVVLLIGFLLLPLVWIYSVVFSIIAGLAANRGEHYRYPLTLRLIK